MTLQIKSVGLVALIFFRVLGASYALFGRLRGEVVSGMDSVYAQKHVLYNRERTLHHPCGSSLSLKSSPTLRPSRPGPPRSTTRP